MQRVPEAQLDRFRRFLQLKPRWRQLRVQIAAQMELLEELDAKEASMTNVGLLYEEDSDHDRLLLWLVPAQPVVR